MDYQTERDLRAAHVEDPVVLMQRRDCGEWIRRRIRERGLNLHSLSGGKPDALIWLFKGLSLFGDPSSGREPEVAPSLEERVAHEAWYESPFHEYSIVLELVRYANGSINTLSAAAEQLLEDYNYM